MDWTQDSPGRAQPMPSSGMPRSSKQRLNGNGTWARDLGVGIEFGHLGFGV